MVISGNILMKIAAGLWLVRFAIEDWKTHSISLAEFLCACLTAILTRYLCIHSVIHSEVIWDLLPGTTMLLFALFLREQIGIGDGLCMLLLGFLAGGEAAVLSACTGSILLVILQLVKGIPDKEKGVTRRIIPYIPFLAMGYGITVIAEYLAGGNSK